MSKQIRGKYTVSNEGLAVTAVTNFFQLVGGTGAAIEMLEIRVWQTSDTTLAMNAIHIERGVGGAGGTARTEDKWTEDGPAALGAAADVTTAFSTQVGTVDWNYRIGWNILQEAVWLPTPEMQLWIKVDDDLALSLVNAQTLTMGYSVTWNEFDV